MNAILRTSGTRIAIYSLLAVLGLWSSHASATFGELVCQPRVGTLIVVPCSSGASVGRTFYINDGSKIVGANHDSGPGYVEAIGLVGDFLWPVSAISDYGQSDGSVTTQWTRALSNTPPHAICCVANDEGNPPGTPQ